MIRNSGQFLVNITASATAQNLAALQYKTGDDNATAAVCWLALSPVAGNTHVVYVGFDAGVSSTNYAFRLELPPSSIPAAPIIITGANTSLASIWISGTQDEDVAVGYIRP